LTNERANISGAADSEDTPTTDGDRFGDIVPRIDGVNLAAGEDDLCRDPVVPGVMYLHGSISCY
jgi:hypothetical protein